MSCVPLTPSECDLRGYDWIALFGNRLFTSGWYMAALQDGRGGIAAIKLWWVAMTQQVPAGSLPNDENELAFLADFGTDTRTWKKHRALAMRGFVLCEDNRWYHPFLAEQAIKAWKCRQRQAEERENWRAKKQRQRNNVPRDIPGDIPGDVLGDFHRDNGQCPPGQDGGQSPMSPGMSPRARLDRTEETGQGKKGRKESNLNNLLMGRTPARESLGQQETVPNGLEELMSAAGIKPPPRLDRSRDGDDKLSDDPAVATQIRRVAKACRIDHGPESHTKSEQILAAVSVQPQDVADEVPPPVPCQPADPIHDIDTQYAAAIAGCTPEQIAKAQRYAARAA